MRHLSILCTAAALALMACDAGTSRAGAQTPSASAELQATGSPKLRRNTNPVRGQYIVVLQPDAYRDPREVGAELARLYRGRLGQVYRHALRGFVVNMTEEDARALAEDSRVKYVEEDGVVHLVGSQTNATWGLDRIDQADLPLNQTYNYNVAGAGVHAYVIDTGIRITHGEITGRASLDFTSINDGNGANDCNGHGTHVAGTIGGSVYGVAKSVTLHAVRVLDCGGSGTWSGVIAGVDWVTANHVKPAVANMSLGGGANQSVDDAVTNSIAAGVTYAIAAGNSSADACGYSPARTPNAITVGATDINDARASFSNYGTCLDIFAPGVNITSAWHTNDTSTNTISGTSMAAPHVAGAAALYLSTNTTASPDQVRSVLVNNGTPGRVTNPGSGSPNVLLYMAWIGNGTGDNVPPTATLTEPASGVTVSGSVTLAADASDNVGVTRVEFYVNNLYKGTDTTAPYSIIWDTTQGGNGSHSIVAKAYDAGGNVGASSAVTVTVNNPGMASYDPGLKAPRCVSAGAYCDTGTLVVGRGPVGPEQNAPNTINNSCADGTSGAFHSDESLDRLRISTLDGSPLAPGKTVRIEATVWAWSGGSSDYLDLYYAADATNPSWTYLTTLQTSAGGAQVLSTTYTLPSGSTQAIRGNWRYLGTASPCTTGSYDDRDDLIFAVGASGPVPPTASFNSACSGLSCNFTDTSTDLDGSIVSWSWSFGDGASSTAQHPSHSYAAGGSYTVSLTVTDDQGLSSTTSKTVTVTAPGSISLSVKGRKVKGVRYADLTWSGANTASVDVFRDGAKVTTTANDGAHTDTVPGAGTYVYRVCEAGTTNCSNDASVTFN